jgi:hypothetical protein
VPRGCGHASGRLRDHRVGEEVEPSVGKAETGEDKPVFPPQFVEQPGVRPALVGLPVLVRRQHDGVAALIDAVGKQDRARLLAEDLTRQPPMHLVRVLPGGESGRQAVRAQLHPRLLKAQIIIGGDETTDGEAQQRALQRCEVVAVRPGARPEDLPQGFPICALAQRLLDPAHCLLRFGCRGEPEVAVGLHRHALLHRLVGEAADQSRPQRIEAGRRARADEGNGLAACQCVAQPLERVFVSGNLPPVVGHRPPPASNIGRVHQLYDTTTSG